jgi:uncharacterized membrane protein
MTVEEAIKMIISGGIVTPPDRRPPAEQVAPQVPAAATRTGALHDAAESVAASSTPGTAAEPATNE